MSGHLTELLTAAVAEIEGLHKRLDGLQSQVDELKAQYLHLLAEQPTIAAMRPTADHAAAPLVTDNGATTALPNNSARQLVSVPSRSVSLAQPAQIPAEPAAPGPAERLPELTFCRDEGVSASPAGEVGDFDGFDAPRRPFVKWLPTTDAELPMIDARCRLKAEASKWACQRRKLTAGDADFRAEVEPRDRDLIWQAKQLPDCFLWMSHPSAPVPADPEQWLNLAGNYDVLASAISVLQRILDDEVESRDYFEKGVNLLAEAQSALRIAVTRLGGPPTDHDQARIFGWLKSVALDRQIFIRRFMRLDDPADPDRWDDLAARIVAFESSWENSRGKKSQRKKIMGRIRYKLTQLPAANTPESVHAWAAVAEDVDALVADGLPPSNVELRDVLMPFVDQLPELAQMSKGFQLAIREIDRYLTSSNAQEVAASEAEADEISSQVADVAPLLSGKAAIIIGGDRRMHAAAALEKAFHLSELIWIDTRAHESVAAFEPYVARPEVAMVLLAIRWSSHSYGEVQEFCRSYNKPLVRLPGGYNPNQVAAQIREQCSNRLGGSP